MALLGFSCLDAGKFGAKRRKEVGMRYAVFYIETSRGDWLYSHIEADDAEAAMEIHDAVHEDRSALFAMNVEDLSAVIFNLETEKPDYVDGEEEA